MSYDVRIENQKFSVDFFQLLFEYDKWYLDNIDNNPKSVTKEEMIVWVKEAKRTVDPNEPLSTFNICFENEEDAVLFRLEV